MWFSQNIQQPSLPQRFPQVGEDTRNEAQSKILTFHRESRSHSVSFRNKVPIFPQSLCPWHGPWTIHYHCSDGFSQKNVLTFVGIEKMLKRSKWQNKVEIASAGIKSFCSMMPELVLCPRDVSHRELRVSSLSEHHGIRDRGEFRTKYSISKDAYISSKKGWYCRQRQGLPLKDTSSNRQCHLCGALPILKRHLQRRNSQRA